MKLCGFEAALDKPLFVIRGALWRAEQGPHGLYGDATPEQCGPAAH